METYPEVSRFEIFAFLYFLHSDINIGIMSFEA
jgi:hypothetical protein